MGSINKIQAGNGTVHNIYDSRITVDEIHPPSIYGSDNQIYLRTEEIQTKDHWNYIIHENGVCECWATVPMSGTCTTALQGNYISGDLTIASGYTRKYPVTFASQPICFVNGAEIPGTWSMGLSMSQEGSNTNNLGDTQYAPYPRIVRGTTANGTISIEVYYYAIGEVAS